jgi:hypothetical protein
MIGLQEKNDVAPICPHCSTPLEEVWMQVLRGFLGKRYIYFCPGCRNVLGISHRKGLWMG